jgi:hypothetical protein
MDADHLDSEYDAILWAHRIPGVLVPEHLGSAVVVIDGRFHRMPQGCTCRVLSILRLASM